MRLQQSNRLPLLFLFSITTMLCVTLVAVRMHYTSRITFVFLLWNIFLALVPYFISTLLALYHHRVRRAAWLWLPFAVWLCFFPNAPYILTDLFHLRQRPDAPFWYDLALILFFAWNGLMLGYASLMDMQAIFSERFRPWVGWVISVGTLSLAGFGIYLGRYLRWNSWDVVSSPTGLLHDIATRVLNPMAHPQAYGVTILFSTFLLVGYVLLLQFPKVYAQRRAQ